MVYVYFLHSSSDHGWYVGQTKLEPTKQLALHNVGRVRATKFRAPLVLAYIEQYENRAEGMKREWYLSHPAGYKEKLAIIKVLEEDKTLWPLRGP